VPVFSYFDRYEPYDGHKLEDYTRYYVRAFAAKNFVTNSDTIRLPCDFVVCSGRHLKTVKNQKLFLVLQFMRPSGIVNASQFKTAIDDLFSSELPRHMAKHIACKTTGYAEKIYNKKSKTLLFTDDEEAQYYKWKHGGRIVPIQHSSRREKSDSTAPEFTNLSLLIIEEKKRMMEGFKPIKDLIYEYMAEQLADMYDRVVDNGLTPVGVKTDCILIQETREQASKYIEFSKEMGGWKYEDPKLFKTKNEFKRIKNEFVPPRRPVIDVLKIENEYDPKEFKKHFDNHNEIMIKAELPGSGKSHAVKHYKGKKILFITPTNKLAQGIRKDGHDAITSCKLLNDYSGGQRYSKGSEYDTTEYDVICFDEIYMYNPRKLATIHKFMKRHPDKKYIATGDLDQLEPISDSGNTYNNIKNLREHMNKAVDYMFPNQITLTICKRVSTDAERQKLRELKKLIFSPLKKGQTYLDVLRPHLKTVDNWSDVNTRMNITFYSKPGMSRDKVNRHIQKQVNPPEGAYTKRIEGIQYWDGMELVCRQHYSMKNLHMQVGYSYRIKKVYGPSLILEDILEPGIEYNVKDKIIMTHFSPPHAHTCHSFQGLTTSEKVTLFDFDSRWASSNWVWTAITRADNLDNIQLFDGIMREPSTPEILEYFEDKVEGYMRQDNAKNRTWTEKDKYVNAEWIYRAWKKCRHECPECRQETLVVYYNKNGTLSSNITVDRPGSPNHGPHIKGNIQIMCLPCNRVKR